eukprot:NODE_60_length_27201_cov_1.043318.p20 type:complete len:157 gc:universal NODE_60_length_27201_cov_1.043318:8281-8751(+)
MVILINLVTITRDQELQLLIHSTCPSQLLPHIPTDKIKSLTLNQSKLFLYNDAHWLPIQPICLEDRVLFFGSTCEKTMESFEWNQEKKTSFLEYCKSQIDVIRKCKLYKDEHFYQCLYCGRFTAKTPDCVILKAFSHDCFCGGKWVNVNAQLSRYQ